MSAGRGLRGRVGLVLAGAALGLGAAELVARWLYVAPWTERLVAEQRASQELLYERNSYNLRGPDYTYPKASIVRRVLALGDSFTFGMGVERDEDIFLRRCERRFNEELPVEGVARLEILNGAIIGSLTDLWVEIWETMQPRFDPDVLLIVFFLRDGTLAASVPEFFDVVRAEVAARNAASWVYRRSYLYRSWRDARDRERIRTHYTRLFRAAYLGDGEETSEWRKAQANLARMASEARARGAAVGFVVFPILAGLDEEPYPFQEIEDLLVEFAGGTDVAVLDLLPAFRGRKGPELWISPHDQHPNAAAHAIAAEALYPFLVRLLER